MVCNPQCGRRWCWGVGGLLDGRALQQATCHSQGMLLSVPHLNGREAPLCPPRPPGAAARSPAAPLRASAASRRPGCEWPGLARTPSWLSSLGCPPPPPPATFALSLPYTYKIMGCPAARVGGMGREKWACGRGRSDPSPEGAVLIPQVNARLAPQPTQAAGPSLCPPSSCRAEDPIFQVAPPFLHSENLFHSRDHP